MLSRLGRCWFDRLIFRRPPVWKISCQMCSTISPSLYWLPHELEPHFVRYKKETLAEYDRLTSSITVDSDVTHETKFNVSRWEQLRPIVDVIEELDVLLKADEDIERLVTDILSDGEDEEEFMNLIRHERTLRSNQRKLLEKQLLHLIAPFDSMSYSPGVQLELLAGAGGREAGIFARDLLQMYRALAEHRGWQFNVTQESTMAAERSTESNSDLPLSKICVEIVGEPTDNSDPDCLGAFGQLRYESGVHRVQRVPVTSRQNKIHTSTVAVSVLPLVDEITVDIPENDLKWEYYRASGAGGQHVNRTDSAVRLTHLPTGTVIACQRERAQHVNKRIALDSLKERLLNTRVQSQTDAQNAIRRSHIGHMDRSEKIRTYNFPQDRITDHRLSKSWSSIHRFMRQTIGLSEAIVALSSREQQSFLRQELMKSAIES